MDVQHQEETAYEHRFPPKLIETEKPRFSVQCYRLYWFGHVKQSELYTGQVFDLEVERKTSCGRPMKFWIDTIKDDLR